MVIMKGIRNESMRCKVMHQDILRGEEVKKKLRDRLLPWTNANTLILDHATPTHHITLQPKTLPTPVNLSKTPPSWPTRLSYYGSRLLFQPHLAWFHFQSTPASLTGLRAALASLLFLKYTKAFSTSGPLWPFFSCLKHFSYHLANDYRILTYQISIQICQLSGLPHYFI